MHERLARPLYHATLQVLSTIKQLYDLGTTQTPQNKQNEHEKSSAKLDHTDGPKRKVHTVRHLKDESCKIQG